MPAGASWPQYLRFTVAALLTMFMGAQTVHIFYNPLNDFDKYVEAEKERYQQNIHKDEIKNS